MILAIETSTHICSVAYQNKYGDIFEKRTEQKGTHSESLFLFIRKLMEDHDFRIKDLDVVLVSSGPGSYTGLRIAASAIKGILFGLDVKIYAGNTLAGFAQSADNGTVHAVINARRNHLYHQKFEKEGRLTPITESQILELMEINKLLEENDQIIGTGIERIDEERRAVLSILEEPKISANNLIHLFNSNSKEGFFQQTTAEELESNYLSSSQVNNTKVK
jgi:tRNA threonylcarbamoyl adenosine modification protein YeaZ